MGVPGLWLGCSEMSFSEAGHPRGDPEGSFMPHRAYPLADGLRITSLGW